ncbi:unnamed protein product [Vicia faba]|uniref:Uncharacterized protein n=1 Tax=Vicia faba TaxID=3906 RepID=A0AAV1AAD2_VICFA|nr:unnamed protein product [Vicia faba]
MGKKAKTYRYAIVTGANKGIGYGICKKLASSGVIVVLTARNEKRGLDAVESLKELGLSDFVVFHQLDVTDPITVASLAEFIRIRFGKLDILVNNAGVAGGIVNGEKILKKIRGEILEYSSATKFFSSTSPRIVNVSSRCGQLKCMPNDWARGVFDDIKSLTNEKLGDVLRMFLKDYKEGVLESKNWPTFLSGYTMAKAALNSYTRLLAMKFPHFRINCLCPEFVKTDINENTGFLSIDEGAECPVKLALVQDNGPTSLFFLRGEVISFQ